jgi:hypothetical protein
MDLNEKGAVLLEGVFVGPKAFSDALRTAIWRADEQGWSEMLWSDPTFEDWPLYERSVVEGLNAWSRKGRKLTLLATNFDAMRRVHHRFVEWRIRWDHLVECRICRGDLGGELPSAFWTPTWALRRIDRVRCTGAASADARERVLLREALDEHRRQSAPGFPATTLGL